MARLYTDDELSTKIPRFCEIISGANLVLSDFSLETIEKLDLYVSRVDFNRADSLWSSMLNMLNPTGDATKEFELKTQARQDLRTSEFLVNIAESRELLNLVAATGIKYPVLNANLFRYIDEQTRESSVLDIWYQMYLETQNP